MQRIIQHRVTWASRLWEGWHSARYFMPTTSHRPFFQRKPREAGISLLEVLMAISLLGISFASIFSGLSTALRATDRLDRIERGTDYAEVKLKELLLDPTLGPGQIRSGVSPSGFAWQAETELIDARPLFGPDRPAQLVRINLEVSWRTRLGRQTLSLQTFRLFIPEPPPNPEGSG
jgi:type II secretory pathway pseudopilin PulG